MTRQFSFLEFFAGGGMARLGLGDSWTCLLANDFDAQKCAAYRANFGGGDLIEADIASLGASEMPTMRADLMWGSFPCQDLSLAGARGGINAKRSGAFFAFRRLAQKLRATGRAPHIIALENVAGLLTSNGGRDFAVVVEAMAALDYRMTAMVLDAEAFTPQSRPRLFVLGFGPETSPAALPAGDAAELQKNAPPALLSALDQLPDAKREQWLWLPPFAAARRNIRLGDLIDWNAPDWHSPAQTEALLAMMSSSQRARVDAIVRNGARRAGAGFRRTRTQNGESVQRFEARFDGVAGCLRTPAGGSSRQIVIAIENGDVRTRLMTAREAARLMGLPETYVLPTSATAALKLCGDGVCVPLVQWLGENIFAPALQKRASKAA